MDWRVALILLSFCGAIVWAVVEHRRDARRRAAQAEARRARARQLHWQYEEDADGQYRMQGVTHGVAWRIEPVTVDSENRKLRWRAEHPRARRAELAIYSRMLDRVMQSVVGRALLSGADPAARELYALPQRMELGSTEFREKFVARVHDPNVARRVVDREVEELFLQWPSTGKGALAPEAHLGLGFDARGVEIEVGTEVTEMAVLEQLVNLGCAVARRLG